MDDVTNLSRGRVLAPTARARTRAVPATWAFRLLHLAFIVAPTLAGLDKFFHAMTTWDRYLAPQVAGFLPVAPHTFMLGVGVVEVAAGLLVALSPRIGGAVVGVWLLGIVGNLLLHAAATGQYLDIALRDLGLALGAFALSLLASAHARGQLGGGPRGGTDVRSDPAG